MELSTCGVGQLMTLAAPEGDSADREVIVGLGGSATVDGGLGMLAALGSRILDATGRPVGRRGAKDLALARSFELAGAEPWLDRHLVVLSDVVTTLSNAADVFAAEGRHRRRGDSSFPPSCRLGGRGGAWAEPARAAGTPGYGCRRWPGFRAHGVGAEIIDGAKYVADLVRFPQRLAAADAVILGEGRLDQTSLDGKVVGRAIELAKIHGIPALAVVGQLAIHPQGLQDVVEASPGGPSLTPYEDWHERPSSWP